jgi:hypothetical protein
MIRDTLGNLTFGHRMVLYRLVIALFLAGMIYYAFYVPGAGERALKRSREAVGHATSWKAQYVSTYTDGRTQSRMEALYEVSCPTSSRFTQNFIGQVASHEDIKTDIRMTTNGASFFYDSKEDVWHRDDRAGRNVRTDCEAVARSEDAWLMPPLTLWMRHAFLKKGERRDTGLSYCQEWLVNLPHGPNAPVEQNMICIGDDDNLPKVWAKGEVTYRYYDWNVPIEFSAPQVAQESRPLSPY